MSRRWGRAWRPPAGPQTAALSRTCRGDLGHFPASRRARLFLAALALAVCAGRAPAITVEPGEFTIAVIPDTQYKTHENDGEFEAMTGWLATNRVALNIRHVAHLGDLTFFSDPAEYNVAHTAMTALDGLLPYSVLPGNHDLGYLDWGSPAAYTNTFPAARFAGMPGYGGSYPAGSNRNSYQLLSAGGQDWLILNLEHEPDTAVLDWASTVLHVHRQRHALVCTHGYLNHERQRAWGGVAIWAMLQQHDNVRLVLCGHIQQDRRAIAVNANGRAVYELAHRNPSYLRLYVFRPALGRVDAYTVDPLNAVYDTDPESQFALPLCMGVVAGGNLPPVAGAGTNQTAVLLDDNSAGTVTLRGTATDPDDWPDPPSMLTWVWQKTAGPGACTIADPFALNTPVGLHAPGEYVFRLTASDGRHAGSAEVTVRALEIRAGLDQTVAWPTNHVALHGAVAEPGWPDPASVTSTWLCANGPGPVTFTAPHALETTASFNVEGLYALRLVASDGVQAGYDELTVSLQPAPPANLAAAALSTNEIRLSWTDATAGEAGFDLQRSLDPADFSNAVPVSLAANSSAWTDTGLVPNTAYHYRLRVLKNGAGSTWAGPVTATTLNDKPAAPSRLMAIALSSSQVRLTWQDNSDNEDGFRLRRSTDNVTFIEIAVTAANATQYTDAGLSPGTTCFYKVKATGPGGGSDYTPVVAVTTPDLEAAEPPSNLAAAAVSSTEILLAWRDNSTTETGFRIRRSTDGETWAVIATVNVNVTNYCDAGLTANTTYDYKVKATDLYGGSDYCAATGATTPAGSGDWLACNDLAWFAGQPGENITTYTTTNAFPAGVRHGELVDYETGRRPGVTLTVDGGQGVAESQGAHPAPGTDAHDLFDGRVSGQGTVSYGEQDLVLTFAGLDPATRYEVALYADRNGSSYVGDSARTHFGTLTGARAFRNASSPGAGTADVNVADDTAVYNAGYNAAPGLLTRFTHIEPGADGIVALRLKRDSARKLYTYANAVMIKTMGASCLPIGEDADRNNLNDAWETAHFGDAAVEPDDDPDGDGISNLDEYIAGTDPLAKPAEAAQGKGGFIVDVRLAGGTVQVAFVTIAADGPGYEGLTRHYALETAVAGAAEAQWSPVPGCTDILGAGQTITHQPAEPGAGTTRLYRARVWLE
ncbi:MAG: metallophosphoesterase [Kiritimatiellae bacterium]|nr:metallophosphoesterase [Kiritimatiellia bacterium]